MTRRAVLGAGVAVVVAWEAIVRFGVVSNLVLAAPSAIVDAALRDGVRFAEGLLLTTFEVAVAAILAWVSGIVLGLLVGSRPMLARAAAPVLAALFAVPFKIFYPLLIAWLGLGPASKIAFGAAIGFFPLALNVISGVRSVDPAFRRMAMAAGASPIQIKLQVVLPLAMPSIAAGLRIATALVVIGVLGTEILASLGGVGYLISYHQSLFDTGHIYLGIVLALTLVYVVNRLISAAERRLSAWHPSQRGASRHRPSAGADGGPLRSRLTRDSGA